jgi:di/tricarboxylate transporter
MPTTIKPQRLRVGASLAIALLAVAVAATNMLNDSAASITFCLILLTLSAFLFSWIPAPLAATLFMLIAAAVPLAPPELVFSGFHSSALWLVVGGMLLSHALARTGMDQRMAALLNAFPGGTYQRALVSVMSLGAALIVIMPSVLGRVVIILPLASAFAARLGFKRGDRGFNGILCAAVGATFLPAFGVLPANYPNLVLTGIAETLFDLKIMYAQWLLMNLPVFGVLKLLLVFVLACWLFPARLPAPSSEPALSMKPGSWTRDQLLLAMILGVAIVLWALDAWHGIAAGWIGLADGIACFLPWLGVAPASEFTKAIDVGPVLMVAGLVAIGTVTASTGLAEVLALRVAQIIPAAIEGPFPVYMALASANLGMQFITTNGGVSAVMLPQSMVLAQALGVDLHTTVAAHIAGYSNLPSPYLATPTMFALHRSGIAKGSLVALVAAVAAATVLLLWPLQYFWLRMIGFM